MNNNYNKKNTPGDDISGEVISWIVTIVLLFAFAPAGIIMLLSKLRKYAKYTNRTSSTSSTSTSSSTQTSRVYSERAQPQAAVRHSSVTQSAVNPPAAKKAKQKTTGKEKKGIAFLLLMTAIILFLIGASGIYTAARDFITTGLDSSVIWGLVSGASFFAGGFVSLLVRSGGLKRVRKFKKYLAVIGDAQIVSVKFLSESIGISEKKVRKDLQAMLDDLFFPENAYFDSGLDSLVLSHGAAETIRKEMEAARDAASVVQPDIPQETQYAAIITELQMLNISIIDEGISDKIDRIEDLTAKIFKIIEDSPEKLPQIRRFMNYYLPTTLKLLRSYATLENQGIRGENITSAKESIDSVLEKLAVGFEQQLDQLFRSENIDISSDISVLENMMAQDGLSDTGNILQTSSGDNLFE